MPGLAEMNALPARDFEELLLGCCAAPGWARRVTEGRPYSSPADLLGVAGAAWAAREPGDLEAALASHPRIGERRLSGWPAQEQAGMQSGAGADPGTLTALADGNAAYEQRFGHVFVICATGRGPAEILAELNRRMSHDPAAEREVAAAEIGKINELRLRRLVMA